MSKQVRLFFICALGLLTTNLFATTQHVFTAGPPVEYVLPVNEPLVISNQFLWTVKAVCTIVSKDDDNYLSFKVIRKSGSLNGEKLSAGDSMVIHLFDKEKMYITAISGAQVELINVGKKEIRAECTIG